MRGSLCTTGNTRHRWHSLRDLGPSLHSVSKKRRLTLRQGCLLTASIVGLRGQRINAHLVQGVDLNINKALQVSQNFQWTGQESHELDRNMSGSSTSLNVGKLRSGDTRQQEKCFRCGKKKESVSLCVASARKAVELLMKWDILNGCTQGRNSFLISPMVVNTWRQLQVSWLRGKEETLAYIIDRMLVPLQVDTGSYFTFLGSYVWLKLGKPKSGPVVQQLSILTDHSVLLKSKRAVRSR